jgi:hypothetical protein
LIFLVNLEILYLSDVDLDKIDRISLELFQNLTKLDSWRNNFAYLLENTFNKHGKLIYNDLSFNIIRDLNVNFFKWLKVLS